MSVFVKSHFRRLKSSVVRVCQHERDKNRRKRPQKELILGGMGDYRPDSAFNRDDLRRGISVEREHTRNPGIAKEIAKDHLTEDKDYYRKLAKMERKR